MNDEILAGFSIAEFVQSEKCSKWNPDTRRCYTNYLGDLLLFVQHNGAPTRELLAAWKEHLGQKYGLTSINVHIAAANNYFRWCGRYDLISSYAKPKGEEDREPAALTRAEYLKMLRAARSLGRYRSYLLIKLFATTNLPLQCLEDLTVDLAARGEGVLRCRGNDFRFRCSAGLQEELLDYISCNGIQSGPVFVTRTGQPMNRVHIFRSLQEVCRAAGVPEEKGNPRSLRNLYRDTQKQIDERLVLLKNQMYDQLLEIEQEGIGWQRQTAASGGSTGSAGRYAGVDRSPKGGRAIFMEQKATK